eukprot:11510792-Heterocapsa_arctica.AAC.1
MSRSQGNRSVLWQGLAPGGPGCQMADSLAFSVARRSEVWPDHLESWLGPFVGSTCTTSSGFQDPFLPASIITCPILLKLDVEGCIDVLDELDHVGIGTQ